MSISSETIRSYYAVCQICDVRGPKATTKRGALIAAIQEGWAFDTHLDGTERVSLCSDCFAEREARQEKGG